MRYLCLLMLCSFTLAQQEIVGSSVKVIFDELELEPYALQVAQDAEKALEILEPYFGSPKQPVIITIHNNTDVYNGFASPLPRPKVSIRALFPNNAGIGLGASSNLFFLLIHELTHVQQFSYQDDSWFPNIGLAGENTARVPPMWFLEGIAVWMESEYTDGGRRDDALTRGLLRTLVLSDHFPDLDDVSLETFGDWPGGNARYLLGGAFVGYLIEHYGIETVLSTLKDFNNGFFDGFSSSWFRVAGSSLLDEWKNWNQTLLEEAKQVEETTTLLTDTASFTSSPVFSPDGKRLAWVSMPSKIVVADFDGKELLNQKTIIERRFPDSLDWLDASTLIYSRIVRQPGTEFLELFTLNIESGVETQLTRSSRAQMPKALPDGCILFVRDLPQEGSKLQRFCHGVMTDYWKAPQDSHLIGLDVSPEGKIVLSLWQQGNVDIAVLENQELVFLTQDVFQDLNPTWQGEDAVIFSSDKTGIFELQRITLSAEERGQETLMQSLGGAFQITASQNSIIYTALGAEGYDLALVQPQASLVILSAEPVDLVSDVQRPKVGEENSPEQIAAQDLPNVVRAYSSNSSMKPYGWVPSFGISLAPLGAEVGMTILSLDDTLQHSLSMNLAYDTTLDGHLFGATIYGSYAYNDNNVYTSLLPPYPFGFGVSLGVWKHAGHLRSKPETALGVQGYVAATLPLDRWIVRGRFEVGLLHLRSFDAFQPEMRLDASFSQLSTDDWNYRTRGQRFGVTGVWSATDIGASFGAWGDAVYYRFISLSPLSGTLELTLRAGYRQSPAVPLTLEPWAAVGSVGYRLSFPVEWRLDDGVYSLERITLEPRLRPYFDGAFGLATDLTLSADTVLGYGAPVSFSFTVGYAEGFWYGLGWRLPL